MVIRIITRPSYCHWGPLEHETPICIKLPPPPLIRNFATQLVQILSLEICQKLQKLVANPSILTKFDQIAQPLSEKWWPRQSGDKVSHVLEPSWMISFDKRGRHLEEKWCGRVSCHHVVYFTDFWKLSHDDQWSQRFCLNRAIFWGILLFASLYKKRIFEILWLTVDGQWQDGLPVSSF